jgi:hypothetical protein
MQPPSETVQDGSRVRIEGLQAKPELNGRTGVVYGTFNQESGRWTIHIDANDASPATQISVRPANLKRLPAAAAPPKSIVHNGIVYKSLADHDPHSTSIIDEKDKLYNLDPPWQLCTKTADALHVCASYPWAAYALVFADGSAHYTALKNPAVHSSHVPGTEAASRGCLRNQGGKYGTSPPFGFALALAGLNVLIMRKR